MTLCTNCGRWPSIVAQDHVHLCGVCLPHVPLRIDNPPRLGELAEALADAAQQRAMVVRVAERLTLASEVLGHLAERRKLKI